MLTYNHIENGQLYPIEDSKTGYLYQYTYDSIGRLIASSVKHGNTVLMQTRQTYNSNNQLTGQSWQVGSDSYSQTYTYDKTDGALTSMMPGDGRTLSMSYDSLRRLSSVTGGVYNRIYSYRDIDTDKTTNQVSRYQYKNTAGTAITFDYTYDVLGNIASYKENNTTYFYIYDDLNQLTEVKDEDGEVLYEYEYDYAGNILSANGKSYTYSNTVWKDLLTAYDEQRILYEGETLNGSTIDGKPISGNPISYYNGTRWDFTWEEGRNLVSADSNVYSIDYTYDLNGLRTSKKVNDVIHYYYYAGGKLLRETYGGNTLDFFYDNSGYPYALKYNGTLYYYITNLQGDVLHLVTEGGTAVVSYTYDPYGKVLDTTGTMATTLGAINPLRYRGYYYDTETGFYYLQSRYYDPSICRFVNADALVSAGQGVLGHNMFSYCGNNSIRNTDPTGYFFWDSKNEEDDDDEYKIVGAGVQFTLSGDYGHISGTFGVEIVVYWDTAECHDTGGPIIAVYVFGEGDITLDFDSLPSEITDLVELLRDSGDLLKEDGINAFQAILAGTKLSASVSGSIFGIMANNTFQNTKNYEGWFDNESISIGSLKAARAWSSSCKTYSFGYSYSFGKPAFYLSWPKITKGKSLYGLLIQFNLGDS